MSREYPEGKAPWMNDPLLINICIPSLSHIALDEDGIRLQNLLRSAVEQQVKLANYVKALVERITELYAGDGGKAL